ncbi:MAG: hypothetical protein AAFX81_00495 [Pseudomonadota bacterium]
MSSTGRGLQYKGFTAHVYYDEEEGEMIGMVPTSNGGVEFRCPSIGSVERDFHALIDSYLRAHPEVKPVDESASS